MTWWVGPQLETGTKNPGGDVRRITSRTAFFLMAVASDRIALSLSVCKATGLSPSPSTYCLTTEAS